LTLLDIGEYMNISSKLAIGNYPSKSERFLSIKDMQRCEPLKDKHSLTRFAMGKRQSVHCYTLLRFHFQLPM
jgi:hypothetical protein